MTDFAQLAAFKLSKGAHETPEQGLCMMEAVAWFEGLPHSDKPECTCPVIGEYVRGINDAMPHHERQKLIPYLPRLVGTVSNDHKQERAEYLAWQALTVFTPVALRACGMEDWAVKLENVKTLEEGRDVARKAHAAAACAITASATAAAYAYAAAAAAHASARTAAYAYAASATAAAYAYAAAAAAYAYAAAAAAAAADVNIWPLALKALDGVLAIGPSQNGFSRDITEPVQRYREMVTA